MPAHRAALGLLGACLLGSSALAQCEPPVAQQWLTQSEPGPSVGFAEAVAFAGSRLVVGSPWSQLGRRDGGAVIVFAPDGSGGWIEEASLLAPPSEASERLGEAVAAEGDRVVAGAPLTDLTGSLHVFEWDGAAWQHEALRPTPVIGGGVGGSVDLDGDRLVAGGDQWSAAEVRGGAAWVYARVGASWVLEAELQPSPPVADDWFGRSVAISGDRVAVGAPAASAAAPERNGRVVVFERVAGSWVSSAVLSSSAPQPFERFGHAVSLQGDTLVVSARQRRPGDGRCGAVFVFEWTGTEWEERQVLFGTDTPASCELFGQSLALRGELLAVGELDPEPGRLHLFLRRDGRFRRLSEIAPELSGDAWGGFAAALATDLVAGAAPRADVPPGQGLVFVEAPCYEEDCVDGVDDEGDGLVDCLDPDCRGPACAEDCASGWDEDGDGLADCRDPDCFDPSCGEDCTDGADNDLDGSIDCEDADCNEPACAEDCGDARDNDGDGLADCRDPDCFSPACPEHCDDGEDNDEDGRVDCRDPDCTGSLGPEGAPCEARETLCADGADNDGDGRADCTDRDCEGVVGPEGLPCEWPIERSCSDGHDNDGDGGVDCADADCAGFDSCPCPSAGAPAGVVVASAGTRLSACGSFPPPEWSHAWDWDPMRDEDGNGNACDDFSGFGCNPLPSWSLEPGLHGYCYRFTSAVASTSGTGEAFIVPRPWPAVPSATEVRCEGELVRLSCGEERPCTRYTWDLDLSFDSDGNGETGDDVDAEGCETTVAAPAGSLFVAVAAEIDHPEAVATGLSSELEIVAAPRPGLPAPMVTPSCAGEPSRLDCGVSEPGVSHSWDLDAAIDSDADGDPRNDVDANGCIVDVPLSRGPAEMTVWARNGVGCTRSVSVAVVIPGPVPPEPSALVGCVAEPVALDCGAAAGLAVSWDFDLASDSDGNGTPDDDLDATDCATAALYPDGTTEARVTVRDALGCEASAVLEVLVGPGVVPGPVEGLQVGRDGNVLELSWVGAAGASRFLVTRGEIGSWSVGQPLEHVADPDAGAGTCDAGAVRWWSDPDDATDGLPSYYLVLAVNDCSGAEGPPGSAVRGGLPEPRSPRTPTASCP